jgi:hypothetical protein
MPPDTVLVRERADRLAGTILPLLLAADASLATHRRMRAAEAVRSPSKQTVRAALLMVARFACRRSRS